MPKTSIHPEWYPNAKVYCDGQLIMKVGSTKPRLNVDIWSGNHPFYTGSEKMLDTEGRVERFMRKYGIEKPYEKLKDLTRGKRVNQEIMADFIDGLDLPEHAKVEMKTLTPANYIGRAVEFIDDLV